MKSTIILKYNEKDEEHKITDDMESYEWTDNASGSADTLTLTLRNDGKQKWMHGYMPAVKDFIQAWIQTQDWPVGKTTQKVYCGKFAIDSLEYSGFPETVELSGISVPINTGFNITQRYKTWKKTTVRTILSALSKNAGIRMQFDAEDHKIDSISQSGKTDLNFAFSICQDYDLCLKIYNKKMVVYNQTKYEKKKSIATIKRTSLGGSGAYRISDQRSKEYNAIKINYTESNGKTLTYSFKRPGTAGNRVMYISEKAESLKDAEVKAKAALRASIRECRTATILLTGDPKYTAATNVELKDFGKFDGKYFADAVTHSKNGGQYTTTLTLHQTVTDF